MPSKKSKRKSVRVNYPPASNVPLTSPSPFSSVPFTTSPGGPIQPKTTPVLRQIVASENVRIIRGKGL